MNVLMVSCNQNFCLCLKESLSKSPKIKQFYIYNCLDVINDEKYSISSDYLIFIDLDFKYDDVLSFINSCNSNKILGFTSNNKSFLKYLNSPNFLRIYKLPIKIDEIIAYINKQFDIFDSLNKPYQITSKLCDLGFNISHCGTVYLIESINVALSKSEYSVKNVYEEVAKKHKTSAKVISWAVLNAINSAYKSMNEEKMESFFKIYDKRKPTPKFIIDFFAKPAKLW